MDVVYPYRTFYNGIELRYSLRSLKNFDHNEVWIVGDIPSWVKGVRHLKVRQIQNKWQNARKNIITACQNTAVSDDFLLMNDDFFIMKPLDEIPVFYRETVDETIMRFKGGLERSNKLRMSRYRAGFIETVELMRWAGIPEPYYSYNLHIPVVYNKEKMLECLAFLDHIKPATVPQCFHLRTWYGNFWQVGGEPSEDVKVTDRNRFFSNSSLFLSCSDTAFQWTGHSGVRAYLERKFPEPSPYERVGYNGLVDHRRSRSLGGARSQPK